MEARSRRWLTGCGLGCAGLLVLLIGSCISFRTWLEAPGELLEPRALLDPEAVGYLEGRLELDNPGTEALFDSFTSLLDSQRPPISNQMVEMFWRWNQGRQRRDLKKLFPARFSWTLYPGPVPPESGSLFTVSIQHASHRFQMADWLMGFVLGRISGAPYETYRGESILVLEDDASKRTSKDTGVQLPPTVEAPATAPASRHPLALRLFMRKEGIFLATRDEVAKHAIDRLATIDGSERGATPLDRLFDRVSADYQFRGAFTNPNGELLALAQRDADEGIDPDLQALLERLSTATIGGGFLTNGDVRVELDLVPNESGDEVEQVLESILERLLKQAAEELPLKWEVTRTDQGVHAGVLLEDVPRLAREAAEKRSHLRRTGEAEAPSEGADTP